MAVITYGGIVVPILQDFNPNDVHHIVNHSESTYSSSPVMPSGSIWKKNGLLDLRGVFSLSDFRCLYQRDGETIQRFLKHLGDKMEETYPNWFHTGRCNLHRPFQRQGNVAELYLGHNRLQ